MIPCDTNILIDFYKGKQTVIQNLRQIGFDQIAISTITQAELFFWRSWQAGKDLSLTSICRHLTQIKLIL